MIEESDIKKTKEAIEEFLSKMTVDFSVVEVAPLNAGDGQDGNGVRADITAADPQVLIGQQGQTLFEMQRLLKIILHKKLQKDFYLVLDINGYRQKKVEYLKKMARDAADEVASTGQNKILPPMSAFE